MSRFSHRVGSAPAILAALALVGGMLAVLTMGAGATVNTCQARNLTRGTARSADLQAVIDAANPGDTVQVKRVCVGNFTIAKDLTLRGEPTRRLRMPVLDANGTGRVLEVSSWDAFVTLVNLKITGGNLVEYGSGAGIDNIGHLTLSRSVVTGNTAWSAAGISNRGDLVMKDSSVAENTSAAYATGFSGSGGITSGRAGHIGPPGGATLILNGSSSVEDNVGTGIVNSGGVTILNGSSSVRGNIGEIGGINADDGTVTMNDFSSVTGNTGRAAGGVFVHDTFIMNDASYVSGNTARGCAAGIYDTGVIIGEIDGVNVFDNFLEDGTEVNIGEC